MIPEWANAGVRVQVVTHPRGHYGVVVKNSPDQGGCVVKLDSQDFEGGFGYSELDFVASKASVDYFRYRMDAPPKFTEKAGPVWKKPEPLFEDM